MIQNHDNCIYFGPMMSFCSAGVMKELLPIYFSIQILPTVAENSQTFGVRLRKNRPIAAPFTFWKGNKRRLLSHQLLGSLVDAFELLGEVPGGGLPLGARHPLGAAAPAVARGPRRAGRGRRGPGMGRNDGGSGGT